jgi:hypothetical protein
MNAGWAAGKGQDSIKVTKMGVDLFILGLAVLVLGVVAFLGWDWLRMITKGRKRRQRQREHQQREDARS